MKRGLQIEGEDDISFSVRLLKSSRLCGHIFRRADIVSYYVCGLKPSAREMVAKQVRILHVLDRTNLAAVNLAPVAIGK